MRVNLSPMRDADGVVTGIAGVAADVTRRLRAEAEAISIYAKSVGQDSSFFEFTRTLDAYKKTLKGKGSFIMSTDSDFLRLMQKK